MAFQGILAALYTHAQGTLTDVPQTAALLGAGCGLLGMEV